MGPRGASRPLPPPTDSRPFPCNAGPPVCPCSYIMCQLCVQLLNVCGDLCLIDLILNLPVLFFSTQPPAFKGASVVSVLVPAPLLPPVGFCRGVATALPPGHLPVTMHTTTVKVHGPVAPLESLLAVREPLHWSAGRRKVQLSPSLTQPPLNTPCSCEMGPFHSHCTSLVVGTVAALARW